MNPFFPLFRTFGASVGALAVMCASLGATDSPVEQWGTFDLALHGPADGNPFLDVQLSATFTDGAHPIEVPGFYDGEGTYRIRFMPGHRGTWHYQTHSNRWPLTGQTGTIEVVAPSGNNHGPVLVAQTYHFAYADGSAYRPFGTTIYNWIHQPAAAEEQTLKTLAAAPFNKVRMLVHPTGRVRTVEGIPVSPFVGTAPAWDRTRFDVGFFRHLEQCISQLRDLGIEADVILFNPYGRAWGFDSLNPADDERYVRYLVARLSAYRNVWWSLANEFDLLRTKQDADWERLGGLVRDCDPFHHLRSIHHSARLYDYRQSWVTHASIQNGSAVEDPRAAELYRDVYEKPIVYDEVKYEGNITRRWGNLTGAELVHRFWAGIVAGTYVGHGESIRRANRPTWISGGGELTGESPARIAFLKRVLDEAPAPINPVDQWQDPTIGGSRGQYYLVYFGHETPREWSFHLPRGGVTDGQTYRVDVLDTWDMTITAIEGTFTTKRRDAYTFVDSAGRSVPLPGKAQIALRIRRVAGPDHGDAPLEPEEDP